MRAAVYTCITGNYDKLLPLDFLDESIDFICFTDAPIINNVNGWKIILVDSEMYSGKNLNRYIKMHPHLFLREYDFSVYVDGNIKILRSPRKLINSISKESCFAVYNHPYRKNVRAEGLICCKIGFFSYWFFISQYRRYIADRFADNALYECNIIFRSHKSHAVLNQSNLWWEEYSNGVKRDQISFPYTLFKSKISVTALGESDARYGNKYFKHIAHSIPLRFSFRDHIIRFINKFLIFAFQDAE